MGKKKDAPVRTTKYLMDGIVGYHSDSLHVSIQILVSNLIMIALKTRSERPIIQDGEGSEVLLLFALLQTILYFESKAGQFHHLDGRSFQEGDESTVFRTPIYRLSPTP